MRITPRPPERRWATPSQRLRLRAARSCSIHLNLAEDLEFLREFHGESVELLQDIEQGILVLEDNPTDAAYH